MALNGGLETRSAAPPAWEHCVPGEGHGQPCWHEFVTALKRAGYDRSLSIEYAGPSSEAHAGIERAVALLGLASALDKA